MNSKIKFVYLVFSISGITCCESLEIAKDVLSNELSFDESAHIEKRVFFTKEIY